MTEIVKTNNQLAHAQMAEKIIKLEQLKKDITAQLDELKAQLLEFTQANDVYTLKTGSYTISRGKRQTVAILDHQAAAQWLFDNGIEPHMVETLAVSDQAQIKEFIKKGKQVNGCTNKETEYISIRVKE